ncbi:MAG: YegS/Rv2252/BmrU family lipid kinase [Rikenellaceae bacterium]|nr:YegS/Rv2252/BmrU family lipid kinase [Rikenellaceae bacterium]
MQKVKFVFNPKAGLRGITRAVGRIIEMYAEYGYEIVPVLLNFDDDCPRRILEGLSRDNYHHVLIAGGDGSVNYVVRTLREAGVDLPIAVIPAGTANDFAVALGMSKLALRACRQILTGVERRVDLGRVGDRYFVNVFSFGLFTNVSQRTPTKLKNILGKAAYLMEGVSEIANLHRMHLSIESDGGSYEGPAIITLVFNGRTAGQFPLARMSRLDDGVFDVLVLKGDSPFATADAAMRYLSGLSSAYPPSDVVHLRCGRLHIATREPEPTDIDGQPGVELPTDVECLAGALRIIVPRECYRLNATSEVE